MIYSFLILLIFVVLIICYSAQKTFLVPCSSSHDCAVSKKVQDLHIAVKNKATESKKRPEAAGVHDANSITFLASTL